MENKGYDQKIMDQVVRLSIESVETGGGPFAAAVVRDGKIVATGVNRVSVINDPTAHGEVMAIRAACEELGKFDLSDCELYTSCEPCPMCLSATYWARIKKVYYCNTQHDAQQIDFDDAFIYRELAKKPEDRSLPLIHIKDPNAIKAFQLWSQKEDKIEY